MRTLTQRRAAAAFRTTTPTKTDQAGAATTDLNVIINQFLRTGKSASTGIPRYGDFTELPTDLRGMIESSRSMRTRRAQLPPELRDLPLEELLALTPEEIKRILAPPKQEGEQKKDDAK